MDRYEFMWKLKSLLGDIPEQEREEALQYYNDYFEDAGKENEASVIASLGSPEKVAENIKKDAQQNGFFDEYESTKVEKGNELVEYPHGQQEEKRENATWENKESKELSAGLIVLLICLSPILFALATVLFCVSIGLIAGCIGLVAGFGGAALGLLAGAVVCVVSGILCMPIHLLAGFAVMGTGFLLVALGLLFLMMTVGICGFVLPKLCAGIGCLVQTCLERKKKA